MALKPVAQAFADELTELVGKFKDTGLTNSECVGTLEMYKFRLLNNIEKTSEKGDKPY